MVELYEYIRKTQCLEFVLAVYLTEEATVISEDFRLNDDYVSYWCFLNSKLHNVSPYVSKDFKIVRCIYKNIN